MSKTYLTSVSSANTNFPKKLLIWNYWDHEHIVGTHFEHYKKVDILFEDDTTCHSERWAKIHYLPFYIKSSFKSTTPKMYSQIFKIQFFSIWEQDIKVEMVI